MTEEVLNLAMQTMKVSKEIVLQHNKYVSEINAYYFWNPVKGGIAVIINEECERLGATSAVSFDKHVAAFKEGKRN